MPFAATQTDPETSYEAKQVRKRKTNTHNITYTWNLTQMSSSTKCRQTHRQRGQSWGCHGSNHKGERQSGGLGLPDTDYRIQNG